MKHTIIHTLAPASTGGLESVVKALAMGQAARGHHVSVVVATVDPDTHPFVHTLRENGIPIHGLGNTSRDFRGERRRMTALIDQLQPTVVHAHGYRPEILHLPIARASGIATVSTLHGFTGRTWKVRFYERLALRSLRRVDALIAVSRGIRDRARQAGVAESRIHVIQNAYAANTPGLSRADARAQLRLSGTGSHIGWIGRISEEKGGDLIIEAFGKVLDSAVTLSVIGDGPIRKAAEERARALGIADRVIFHGIIPDAARFVRAFDAVVLSSRTEGTPMVVLEAMAAEIPLVVPAVGGIPDMLSDNEAILVSPKGPGELAAGIDRMLDDPSAAYNMARAAHLKLTRDFSVDAWLDRHDALYTAIQHHARHHAPPNSSRPEPRPE